MKNIILVILVASIALFGCQPPKQFEVKLSSQVIEYQTDYLDVCSIIVGIDDVVFEDFEIEQNKITSNEYKVSCKNEYVRKLGKAASMIDVNGVQVKIEFEVVDHTAPTLEVKDSYEVEEGNTFFDIKKEVVAKDLFTKQENLFIGFSGVVDINKLGEYPVKVSVKDENGNEQTKDVLVRVIEKEIEIVIQEVPVPGPSGGGSTSGGSNSGGGGSNIAPQTSPAPKPSNPGQYNKSFMFSSGYDFNSGYDACYNYLSTISSSYGVGGECQPIQADGIYTGYSAVFY